MSEYDQQSEVPQPVDKLNNARANLRAAQDVVGADGVLQARSRFSRCGECVFFERPNSCKIVEGPVAEDLVCNWIQVRTGEKRDDVKLISVPDMRALAWGLMKRQPFTHKVLDHADTAVGPLLLIEDAADPPHYFSISLRFFIEHVTLEHGWTQEEADRLTREGKAMDFKPPVSYDEASELYGRGELSREEFEPFRRARAAEQRAKKP